MADHRKAMERGLDALSQFLVDEATLGDTLLRVAELACEVAPADLAGITMMVEGRPRTSVFTDIEAPEIDEAQYESGEGPCLDAFRQQSVFIIDSISDESRWPQFVAMAGAHGILSTLSVPVTAKEEGLGALNLYSRHRGVFDSDSADRVQTFARQAAVLLVNSQTYWDAHRLSENLKQALESRATIDHAIGILMGTSGRSPEDTFQTLVQASQRENRKIRELAEEIVARAMSGTIPAETS